MLTGRFRISIFLLKIPVTSNGHEAVGKKHLMTGLVFRGVRDQVVDKSFPTRYSMNGERE